ncbi:hypothetical protein DL767_010147 [Monosporascus sp. MG133]|nr:hypothetical protein DL767_010147 [Monosporascus sp. MG133]
MIYRETAAGAVTICFFCGAAIECAARPGCDDVVCVCGNRIKYCSGDDGGSAAPWFAQHGGPELAVQKFAPQWILAEAEIARKRERKAKARELAARFAIPGQPTPSAVDKAPDFAYHFSGLRPEDSNPTPPRHDKGGSA